MMNDNGRCGQRRFANSGISGEKLFEIDLRLLVKNLSCGLFCLRPRLRFLIFSSLLNKQAKLFRIFD
jgi:hypothetical protein